MRIHKANLISQSLNHGEECLVNDIFLAVDYPADISGRSPNLPDDPRLRLIFLYEFCIGTLFYIVLQHGFASVVTAQLIVSYTVVHFQSKNEKSALPPKKQSVATSVFML